MSTKSIGRALQDARKAAGLSQSQAGAALVVSHRTIQKWESGERCPSLPQLPKIAAAYNIEPWDLARMIFDSVNKSS